MTAHSAISVRISSAAHTSNGEGSTGIITRSLAAIAALAIDDQYTDSRSGVRHFSLHTLVGDKVLIVQPDAYDLVEFKVS